ncbi:MAG TPA: DUF1080 domain-containing protein [Burkholderiales bacterium]|nr:DUF1080 domain-containing protein [Burkholderiales bacterium]
MNGSVFAAAAAGALACSAFAADAPNTLTPAEKAAGWRLLFDGRTLNGWEDPAREKPPGDAWTVEDGCIRAVPKARVREDLPTLETFGDFELAFEWKISPRGNSGVKYRIQDRLILVTGAAPGAKFEDRVEAELRHRTVTRGAVKPGMGIEEYLVAFEYQVIDDHGHPDAAHSPDRAAGSLYSMLAPSKQAAKPAGQFNQAKIVVRGENVEHWLNGEKVLTGRLDAPAIGEKLAKRWGKGSKVYQLLTAQPKKKTPIALQHHVDEAWFRTIKIRELR